MKEHLFMSEENKLEIDGIRLSIPVGKTDEVTVSPEEKPAVPVAQKVDIPFSPVAEPADIPVAPVVESAEIPVPEAEAEEELDIRLSIPVAEMADEVAAPATPAIPAETVEPQVTAPAVPATSLVEESQFAPVAPVISEPAVVAEKKAPVRALLREPESMRKKDKVPRKKRSWGVWVILLLLLGGGGFVWWKYPAWVRAKIDNVKSWINLVQNVRESSESEDSGEESTDESAEVPAAAPAPADTDAPAVSETPTAAADSGESSERKAVPSAAELFAAIDSGNKSLLIRLIADGADITVTDEDGNNVLHRAAMAGNPAIMVELLKKWSDGINAKNRDGNTPLHLAAQGGHAGIIRILRGKRARIMPNNDGKKPVDLTSDENIKRIFRNW